MAPTKPILPLRVSARSRTNITSKITHVKRKADASPTKEGAVVKRSAFGDVTNEIVKRLDDKSKQISKNVKKLTVQSKVLPTLQMVTKLKHNENVAPLPPGAPAHKIQTRASLRTIVPTSNQTILKPKENVKLEITSRVKTRLSNEFEKTEETLYSSALEEINTSASTSSSAQTDKLSVTIVTNQMESQLNLGNKIPDGVKDFDKENWDDVFQVSKYAMDIFNYLKSKESQFIPNDYMERQICLSRWMRSLLVDWMVEIQESFELNHETLYLGVKLVDLYLSKMTVSKEMLQLVGAASMFIASKYDERITPYVEDFLYICDGAYTKRELLRMEINVLKICEFNLGIPLSYRFLRRYARCAKVTMPILTLARYILEFSLMNYETIMILDSKLASASLYLALQMSHISSWTPTLEYYTGYVLGDFINVVHILNLGLHSKPNAQIMTIRNKYTHKIFFEVAKTPLLSNQDLK